jgi:uncharacterized protein
MKWVKPNTITGPPAEGIKYLRRQYINDDFWDRIKKGEHLLITAPRRVGKSSIMKDLENNCPSGYIAVYNDIESDKTQRDFFKRLFTLLIVKIGTHKRIKKEIALWLKTKSIGEFSMEGSITITSKDLNYKEELLNLIHLLGKESIHVVMLLDEFPEVIQNITKNETEKEAIDTLHTLRSIRHEKKFKNFSFVFAGSIGLHHVVSKLDRPKLINDLIPIHINNLSFSEANKLASQLLKGATMKVGPNEKDYLFKKISCLLPYYIQLMIEKCNIILQIENRPILSIGDIDSAFIMVIKDSCYFEDWESRLSSYYSINDAKYCKALLTRFAHFDLYTIQEAYDLSKKMAPESGYKHLIDEVLLKDGYLIENQGFYTFLSPFLREWWKNRHPKFEIED